MAILSVRKIGAVATIPPVHWGNRCLPSFARIPVQDLKVDSMFTGGGNCGVSCSEYEAFWLTMR